MSKHLVKPAEVLPELNKSMVMLISCLALCVHGLVCYTVPRLILERKKARLLLDVLYPSQLVSTPVGKLGVDGLETGQGMDEVQHSI